MEHRVGTYRGGQTRGETLDYLLYLPLVHGQDSEKRWPLILFLHGAGERGSDVERVARQGLPARLEGLADFPFICLAPQCMGSWGLNLLQERVAGLVEEAVAKLGGDPERVYLTGISMGGAGAWLLGALRPDLFAAVAPICGYASPAMAQDDLVCRLKDVPVWAFHGAKDDIVPASETRELVEGLERCGATVRLTIYDDAGHDSWTRTYADPDLYDWFLEHKQPGPSV